MLNKAMFTLVAGVSLLYLQHILGMTTGWNTCAANQRCQLDPPHECL